MTEDITRQQALEALRSAHSRASLLWESSAQMGMGELVNYLQSEINRLELGKDYRTPAPAPVDLPFNSLQESFKDYTPEEDLMDFISEIADEYDVPLTNNEPRWQDGRWLRELGAFTGHVQQAVTKSGAYYPRRQYEALRASLDEAVDVANAEKQKRIELELELEMWQKGYRK